MLGRPVGESISGKAASRKSGTNARSIPGHPRTQRLARWIGRGLAAEDRFDYRLLAVLVAIDLCFVALYGINATTSLLHRSRLFAIQWDGGYPEWFQYTKEISIAVVLALVATVRRRSLYVVLSVMFLYLFADDFLLIHERAGIFLASTFGLQARFGLKPMDLGELGAYAIIAAVFGTASVLAYRRSDTATRAVGRWFVALMALLAFAGVAMDMAHARLENDAIAPLFTLLEDGGEMLVMSAITAFSVGLFTAHSR